MIKIDKEKVNILWSDDPEVLAKQNEKTVTADPVPSEHTLKVRLEKNKRGGKLVTVIFELPSGSDDYFTGIAKKLKSQCGSGGAYKNSQIEMQGDHREKIKNSLEKLGYLVKLAGG